jgi:multiple sugar transport system permease protein
MFFASLKPETQISELWLLSKNLSLKNYSIVFAKIPILRAFFNSLLVSTTITLSVIVFGSIVGYALSRLNFKGRDFILLLILFTMMIPFQITLIPTYVLIVKLGLVDSYAGLIFPGMMNSLAILIFRGFLHHNTTIFDRVSPDRWLQQFANPFQDNNATVKTSSCNRWNIDFYIKLE